MPPTFGDRYAREFLAGWGAMDFGERAATVRSTGGWLDLRARKLVPPPPGLLAALQQVPRVPGFVELAAGQRQGP